MISQAAQALWDNDPASRGLGMQLIEARPARAVITMTITPAMANGLGICHGGLLFTMADSAMAFVSNSQDEPAVATSCTIAFLRPGKVGDLLTATAEQKERAGRTGIYDVTVRDQHDTIIAEFRGMTRTIAKGR